VTDYVICFLENLTMDMDIQTREYHLPEPVAERLRLWFFSDRHHFLRHVRDHFAQPHEPWEALLGEPKMKKVRQICVGSDVSLVEDVYDDIVKILDDGIDGSVDRPVFVVFTQRMDEKGGKQRQGYCFLADKGFYVVAYGDCIRTALFVSDSASDSPVTLFRNAWHALRRKFGQTSYDDVKGGHKVLNEKVAWVSELNWKTIPVANPQATGAAGSTGTLHARLNQSMG
jgi:hypothetical protein